MYDSIFHVLNHSLWRLAILCCLLVHAGDVVAQVPDYRLVCSDLSKDTKPEEVGEMLKAARIILSDLYRENVAGGLIRGDILQAEGRYYLLVDGFSFVYLWDQGAFTNLYRGNYHRYNQGRTPFAWNGKIMAYGGGDKWRFFNRIIYFDHVTNEWELFDLDLRAIPNDFTKAMGMLVNYGQILVLFESEPNTSAVARNTEVEAFEISLGDKEVRRRKKLNATAARAHFMDGSIQVSTQNYHFSGNADQISLISNDDFIRKWYYPDDVQMSSFLSDYFSQGLYKNDVAVRGDSIFFFRDGEFLNTLDVGDLFEMDGGTMGSFFAEKKYSYLWMLVPAFLLLGIFIFRKNGRKTAEEAAFPYPELLDFKGQVIAKEKLDQILGLEFLSDQGKLNKRAELLKLINRHHKHSISISRVKNPDDNRIYDYRID